MISEKELADVLQTCDKLTLEAKENISSWFYTGSLPLWAKNSISELLKNGDFDELNDRFYKSLEFGTGGMRGRTIGKKSTSIEKSKTINGIPEYAAVGSAYLNDFNVIRATMALFIYSESFLKKNNRSHETPSIVISHDARYFSRHFCELAASTWIKLGGNASIFDGPRSTPQLSFSVRFLKATVGVMITASHNPFHDNGLKAYFEDGAQMVAPHADGVIDDFNKIELSVLEKFYTKDISAVKILKKYVDEAYIKCVEETVLYKKIFDKSTLKIVFTPLHGTGAISTVPVLKKMKINFSVVDKQNDFDPRFSSVASPNPENHEALTLAIEQAKHENADIVLATDPDGDRLAVAAKNNNGEFEFFTGNITNSMLLEYRLARIIATTEAISTFAHNMSVIKTFVTTPLINRIAEHYGIKCVNTLTGFKWIGQKMMNYELSLEQKFFKTTGIALNYNSTKTSKRHELLLCNSTLFVLGCEESYGCLSSDLVRDKDANSAVLMICELAAYMKSQGKTLGDFRDSLYSRYGFFGEDILNIYYEGASGEQKINNILASYKCSKPTTVCGAKVLKFMDFSTDTIVDSDGCTVPAQDFFFVTLENGCSYAVRASGTEPKIKFYLFSEAKSSGNIEQTKSEVKNKLSTLKDFLKNDADSRTEYKH